MVTLRVNNCCECFGLRSGSLYTAIVYMVVAILNIVLAIIGLASAGGEAARYGRIATDGLLVILCILLLIGVLKSNYVLCMIWVVGAVVWIVLTIVFGEVATIYAGKKTDVGSVTTVGGAAMATAIGLMWGIIALEVVLLIYCAVVVYSHAQRLREEGIPPPYSQFQDTTKPDSGGTKVV
ncbi:Hypp6022 [Branchiostoma lanceolatum]|uniref:Hypp6022 protein n=1 Tax=Branchiostoma lanceolatum TaxID=7740 RepID=A0A8J9W089_BRALA|nr:Hypp6022 [Branchiostoma lanceolatum]